MKGQIKNPSRRLRKAMTGVMVCPHCGGRIPLVQGRPVEAFYDEQAAIAKLEEILWPNGPACPRCGENHRVSRVTGKGARNGLLICLLCRKQFRVTIGTIFQDSHIPIHKWFYACALYEAGVKTREIQRMAALSYTSARRILETIVARREVFDKIIENINTL